MGLATRLKQTKIYHSNDAHQALANMTLASRRILYMCLSQLERETDAKTRSVTIKFDPDKVFKFTANEYAQICNIDTSEAYRQLKEGIYNIRTYAMTIPESVLHPQGRGKAKDWMNIFTVANQGGYSDGEGYIEIKLAPEFAPFISDLTKNFTGQFLLSAVRLPKGNAYKLYLLLSKWVSSGKTGYCEIELNELKNELGADSDSYNRFNTFESTFFKRASKQVVEITEFVKIEMKIIERKARKAHKVIITYEIDHTVDKYDENGKVIKAGKLPNKLAAANVKLSPSERYREKLRKQGKTPTF